jgi:hypothetical protein
VPEKKINKKLSGKKKEPIVSENVPSYETHPFFIKKANEAKAFLKAVGLPKKLAKKAL